MPSTKIKYIRIHFSSGVYKLCLPDAIFSKIKIIKEQLFSEILELGITFVSRFKSIPFDHYLTKPKSMLEWKLLAMSDKNPEIGRSFDFKRHDHLYNHPFFREFFDIYLDDFY